MLKVSCCMLGMRLGLLPWCARLSIHTLPAPAHEHRAPQMPCQGLLAAWTSCSAFCTCFSNCRLTLPLAQVDDVAGNDVVCTARNNASLDGLLTIFHTERSSDTLQNVQNDLQILSQVRTGQPDMFCATLGTAYCCLLSWDSCIDTKQMWYCAAPFACLSTKVQVLCLLCGASMSSCLMLVGPDESV